MSRENIKPNEGRSLFKDKLNEFVCTITAFTIASSQILKNSSYHALYLEGQSMRTTETMIRFGVDRNRLVPVSNEVELEKMQVITPNAIFGWLDTVFGKNGLVANHFATVWLDYCGSWFGNQTLRVKPRKDLKAVLKWYVTTGSNIFITISTRGRRGTTKENTMNDIKSIIEHSKFPNSIIVEPITYRDKVLKTATMMFIRIVVQT